MPDAETLLRSCFDCGRPCARSRCELCARQHRARARHAITPTTEQGLRARWGHAFGRTRDSGGDLMVFIEASVVRDGDCWNWPGGRTMTGYGSYGGGGKVVLAHRLVYELAVGEIPVGAVIHHACANRLCVNPAHLQAVTAHENTAEMLERNTYLRRIEYLERLLRDAGIEP